MHVGDTVRIIAADHSGEIGELRVIEPLAFIGDFYGVWLDSTETIVFFWPDELEPASQPHKTTPAWWLNNSNVW